MSTSEVKLIADRLLIIAEQKPPTEFGRETMIRAAEELMRLATLEEAVTERNEKMLTQVELAQALGVIQFLIEENALTVILQRTERKPPINICARVISANTNGLNIDLWIDETVEQAAAR